jgi:tetracycline resistance efflux pump
MEHFSSISNWVTIVPPILLIFCAIITKDVIFSIFFGIFSSALIFTRGNIPEAFLYVCNRIVDVLKDPFNIRILLFLLLLAGVIGLISKSGCVKAFERTVNKHVKSKRSALIITYILGLLIFVDDYFNALTVGTVMRPITDKKQVSRAKLAFIINTTAAPVCVLIPLSSWVVYVISQIQRSTGFNELNISAFGLFMDSIPYNFYAILVLFMALAIIIIGKDFGLMKKSEERAVNSNGEKLYNEKYGKPLGVSYSNNINEKKAVYLIDMLLPISILVILAFTFFPLVGYMEVVGVNGISSLEESFASMTILQAFDKTDAAKALFYTGFLTAIISYIYFVSRKLIAFREASNAFIEGMNSTLIACFILMLSWTFAIIMKHDIQTGTFLSNVIKNSNFPIWLLPPILFIFCAFIAFTTGTPWATFALIIPIAVQITIQLSFKYHIHPGVYLPITVASIMGGGIFGHQSSPVADITIMSATGANAPHLEHVLTQLYYTGFVTIFAFFGSLVVSLYPGNYFILPIFIFLEIFVLVLVLKYKNRSVKLLACKSESIMLKKMKKLDQVQ